MDSIMRLAALAVTGALCALLVRKQAPELGLMLALTAGVLLFTGGLGAMGRVRAAIDDLTRAAGLSSAVVAPVVKTVGISLVTRVAAAICRDSGEGGIAACLEIAGTMLALAVTLPLLRAVLSLVTELL